VKRIYALSIMALASLFLWGCQSSASIDSLINKEATEKWLTKMEEGELPPYPDVGDEDIFDFAFINGAPKTEESHEIDEIIKMYTTSWTIDELHHPIAIDIANNEIYVEPDVRLFGVEFETERKEVDDTDKVLELFATYDVLNWQNYYSNVKDYHSYEDGASWSLMVQYEDGTTEKFYGNGTLFREIIPDHYDDFMKELGSYVTGHLGE